MTTVSIRRPITSSTEDDTSWRDLLPVHPAAEIFPLMSAEALEELAADIKAHGMLSPVVVMKEANGSLSLLDGRNRLDAAEQGGVEVIDGAGRLLVPFEVFDPEEREIDPFAFVISANLCRRHLSESQRAMVAAKLPTLRRGDNQHTAIAGTSQREKAVLFNVSSDSIARASVVCEHGVPELIEAAEQGQIAVSVAAKIARLPPDRQREATANPDRAKHMVKRVAREAREVALAAKTAEVSQLLGYQLYGVILADPPWQFEPWSPETGMDRAADNHYPTMTLETIAMLELPAAFDCALFLWATAPMLEQAMELIKRWGLTYKSYFVWLKPNPGTGYWTRNQVELLLVATRGNIPAPAMGDQPPQVMTLERGRHSEKPDAFAEMIERMFPHQPRLEMFAHRHRAGWDSWGNEAPAT